MSSSNFEDLVNDVTMAVWNRLTELPEFRHLQPKDYPRLAETLCRVLSPYRMGSPDGHR